MKTLPPRSVPSPVSAQYPSFSSSTFCKRGLRIGIILTGAISAVLTGPPARALDQIWKTTGFTDGQWADSVTGNWVGDGVPGEAVGDTSTDTATFQGGTNTAVMVEASRNIKSITFDQASGYTFAGGPLVLSNAGAITINGNTSNSQNINTDLILTSDFASPSYNFINNSTTAGVSLNLGGNITGNSFVTTVVTLGGSANGSVTGQIGGLVSLVKSGTGTWILSGANTYSGTTSIGTSGGVDSGTLQLSGLGQLSNGATTVFAGTLDLNGTTQAITTLTLGGGAAGSTAAVVIGSGTLNLGGNVTFTSTNLPNGATISGAGGGKLSLNGTRTFTIGDSTAAAVDTTVSAVIQDGSSASGLTKAGAGTLLVSGNNTFSGGLILSAGVLRVGIDSAGSVGSVISSAVGTGTLALNGGTLSSDSTSARTLLNAWTLGANVALGDATNTGALTLSGPGTISGASRTVTVNTGTTVELAGNIGESAGGLGLTKAGAGTLILSGTNSFTGNLTLTNGTLRAATAGINGGVTAGNLVLNGGTLQAAPGGIATAKAVSVGANTTFDVPSGSDSVLTGSLSGGNFSLTKTGLGALTIASISNTRTGSTVLNGGTLNLNSAVALGATGSLTLTSGTFDNTSGSPVVLSSTGNITLSSDVTFGGTNDLTFGSGNLLFGSGATVRTITLNRSLAFGGSLNGTDDGNNHTIAFNGPGYTVAFNGWSIKTGGSGGRNYSIAGTANVTINGPVINGQGTNSFTYSGTGVLTFAADGSNYTGGATVSSGTLQIGNGGPAGNLPSNVTDNGSLIFNRSTDDAYVKVISGAGTVEKRGAGILTLSGVNTFTGATTINSGTTLQVGDGTTGSINATSSILNNGTLIFNRSGADTLAKVISGSGRVEKTGAGILTLTADNSYSGTTTINAGAILQIGSGSVTGTINGTSSVIDNGALIFNRSDSISFAIAMSGTGTVEKKGAGSLTLSGANSFSGGLTITAGTVLADNASAGTIGSGKITMANNTTLNLNGNSPVTGLLSTSGTGAGVTILNNSASANTLSVSAASGMETFAGLIKDNSDAGAGTLALVKAGAATQIFTGANSYSGSTTITDGTLLINGSLTGTNSVIVNGGTLGGGALGVGGLVNLSAPINVGAAGTIAPGGGIGLLRTGSATFAPGANLILELNGSTEGTGYDQWNLAGTVDLGPGADLFVSLGADFVPAFNQTFTVLANDDTIDPIAGIFGTVNGSAFGPNNSFSLTNNTGTYSFVLFYNGEGAETFGGNDLVLQAVPEPGACWCLLGGVALLGGLPRRRRAMIGA